MVGIVYNAVSLLLELYWYILLARLLFSFFPDISGTLFGRAIFRATEFYLGAFRRMIPPLRFAGGYIDVSYIAAFIAYWFIEKGLLFLVTLLFGGAGMI